MNKMENKIVCWQYRWRLYDKTSGFGFSGMEFCDSILTFQHKRLMYLYDGIDIELIACWKIKNFKINFVVK